MIDKNTDLKAEVESLREKLELISVKGGCINCRTAELRGYVTHIDLQERAEQSESQCAVMRQALEMIACNRVMVYDGGIPVCQVKTKTAEMAQTALDAAAISASSSAQGEGAGEEGR